MSAAAPASPRARLRALLKPGGAVSPALLLPLAHAVAAQVEALDVQTFLTNATKLTKGLGALHQILQVDGIVCGCNAGIELEALGVEMDTSGYPPRPSRLPSTLLVDADAIAERVKRLPRVAAATEATRRLGATCSGQPVLLAAMAGPAAVAHQIALVPGFEQVCALRGSALIELTGRIILELTRQFLQAGTNLILLLEREWPAVDAESLEAWRAALAPVANLARFHKAVPALLVTHDKVSIAEANVPEAPPAFVACRSGPPSSNESPRSWGLALGDDPTNWTLPGRGFSLVTTTSDIPPDTDIGVLRDACGNLRRSLAQAASGGQG